MSFCLSELPDYLRCHIVVNPESNCWEWDKAREGQYGSISWGRTSRATHRVTWELANNREIPDGMLVCHHCDNRRCCNPEHLFIGSQRDNSLDMVRKGRHKHGANHSPLPKVGRYQQNMMVKCTHEQTGRWRAAAERDHRGLSSWVRLTLDRAAGE